MIQKYQYFHDIIRIENAWKLWLMIIAVHAVNIYEKVGKRSIDRAAHAPQPPTNRAPNVHKKAYFGAKFCRFRAKKLFFKGGSKISYIRYHMYQKAHHNTWWQGCAAWSWCYNWSMPDMIFVQKFTQPDFQATSFTPQKCVIYDIFLANWPCKCI